MIIQQTCYSNVDSSLVQSRYNSINLNLLQNHYKNSSDDMDENLSDVASDYGGSNEIKKHKKWQKNYWQCYCMTWASKPGANLRWSDPEQAMQQISKITKNSINQVCENMPVYIKNMILFNELRVETQEK
uniref:Uncharacterized protein n=1 Tax=Coccidioides posadasii RMSCC 3488 TaxID=454284 RepID=A0A0J6IH21_COCPO|nr:hypothetical protein CPAG_07414 [Coccidioides posadasii RMSCC 3488]